MITSASVSERGRGRGGGSGEGESGAVLVEWIATRWPSYTPENTAIEPGSLLVRRASRHRPPVDTPEPAGSLARTMRSMPCPKCLNGRQRRICHGMIPDHRVRRLFGLQIASPRRQYASPKIYSLISANSPPRSCWTHQRISARKSGEGALH